jgi:hypothetical protein
MSTRHQKIQGQRIFRKQKQRHREKLRPRTLRYSSDWFDDMGNPTAKHPGLEQQVLGQKEKTRSRVPVILVALWVLFLLGVFLWAVTR